MRVHGGGIASKYACRMLSRLLLLNDIVVFWPPWQVTCSLILCYISFCVLPTVHNFTFYATLISVSARCRPTICSRIMSLCLILELNPTLNPVNKQCSTYKFNIGSYLSSCFYSQPTRLLLFSLSWPPVHACSLATFGWCTQIRC